jgi:Leucine-rich repeat (LRR) protein
MKKLIISSVPLKRGILYFSMCVCTLGLHSCSDDYDDTWIKETTENLKDRVAALEEWQKSVNSDILSLQSLIEALEGKDYVTGVTPLPDGTGYVISFLKSGDVTIKHGERGAQGEKGEDGVTPVISVKQDTDGKYYWTINGEWLLDDGNKMPVTGDKGDTGDKGNTGDKGDKGDTGADGQTPYIGNNGNWWIGTTDTGVKAQGDKGADAIAPQVRINPDSNEWEISVDGGTTWTSTGVKATGDKGDTGATGAQGDSMFSDIDNTNEDYVELTLADGVTKIKLPKYVAFSIAFESDEVFYASPSNNELTLVLPATLKESDYRSIVATVTATNGAEVVQTRSTGNQWNVTVTKPSFGADGVLEAGSAKVAIMGTENTRLADTYLLRVALVAANGTEVAASRLVQYFDGVIAESQSDITDNTVKRLAWKGDMAETDFEYIRNNMAATLEALDLSATTLTDLPTRALAFYSSMGLSDNTTLKEVVLPDGLKTIGNSAFAMCKALNKLDVPSTVTMLGSWILEGSSLLSFTIPEGLTTLSESTFYGSNITEIRIPTTITEIPNYCFSRCGNLERIYLHDGIISMGKSAFIECFSLERFTIPKGVTVLSQDLFASCRGLREVYLHENITKMESSVFENCKSLTFCSLSGAGQNILPNNLTEIGTKCFYSTPLKQMNMRSTKITAIPEYAFYTCENLKEITLPSGLQTIGTYALSGCPFTYIELPATLTHIDNYAFLSCNDLYSVTCKAITPPTLGTNYPFTAGKVQYLSVPSGYVDTYKSSDWNKHFTTIR